MEIWPNEACDTQELQNTSDVQSLTISFIRSPLLQDVAILKGGYVTVVLWTSSHILYGLPLHQKGDVSKTTC